MPTDFPFSKNPPDPLISRLVLSVLRMVVNLLYLLKGHRSIPDLNCLSQLPWYQSVCGRDTKGFSIQKVGIGHEKRTLWRKYNTVMIYKLNPVQEKRQNMLLKISKNSHSTNVHTCLASVTVSHKKVPIHVFPVTSSSKGL